MGIILWIIVIILGLLRPRSRIVTVIQLLYIIIIIGFNSASPDYSNYEFMYKNIDSEVYKSFEPGYVILNRICNRLGMSFIDFRIVVCFIMVHFLCLAIRRIERKNYVLSVFIIYPVVCFASGVRYAIPFAIMVYNTIEYIYSKKGRPYIKFILLTLLSVMFHYSFVLFLPIIFVKNNLSTGRLAKVLLAEISVFVLGMTGMLYNIVSRYTQHVKILTWLDFRDANSPSLLVDVCIIGLFTLTFYIMKKATNTKLHFENSAYDRRASVNLTWYILFYMPFCFVNVTFERLEQVLFSICAVALADQYSRKDIRRFLIPIIGFVINVAFNYVIHGNIFFPILINNYLL